ncbi:hypothetical protein CLOM_g12048 [Closterium sp. NIES-68]|nr:hypothetical protein CLOM_g12048 [Closterium sp. NIES-68]GJP72634.1 hypothetical protein CLOP_g3402 [Closterium sp. NIES-67]
MLPSDFGGRFRLPHEPLATTSSVTTPHEVAIARAIVTPAEAVSFQSTQSTKATQSTSSIKSPSPPKSPTKGAATAGNTKSLPKGANNKSPPKGSSSPNNPPKPIAGGASAKKPPQQASKSPPKPNPRSPSAQKSPAQKSPPRPPSSKSPAQQAPAPPKKSPPAPLGGKANLESTQAASGAGASGSTGSTGGTTSGGGTTSAKNVTASNKSPVSSTASNSTSGNSTASGNGTSGGTTNSTGSTGTSGNTGVTGNTNSTGNSTSNSTGSGNGSGSGSGNSTSGTGSGSSGGNSTSGSGSGSGSGSNSTDTPFVWKIPKRKPSPGVDTSFDKYFKFPDWCKETNCRKAPNGTVTLSATNNSVGVFHSKDYFKYGVYTLRMKLPSNYSGGIIPCFYLISPGPQGYTDIHDEIDFEFIGGETPGSITIHTNLITGGQVKLEQFRFPFDPSADFHTYSIVYSPLYIMWMIDDYPIRITTNDTSHPFPTLPMEFKASIWDSSSWSWLKANYSNGPIQSQYREFDFSRSCQMPPDLSEPPCLRLRSSKHAPWLAKMTLPQIRQERAFKKYYTKTIYPWSEAK